jgi:hypothetical protein
MHATMPKHGTRAILGALLATCIGATLVASASENADSHVFPVNSKPYGLSYGEWSARQWQWLFSLPAEGHPLFDTADCSAGVPCTTIRSSAVALSTVPPSAWLLLAIMLRWDYEKRYQNN